METTELVTSIGAAPGLKPGAVARSTVLPRASPLTVTGAELSPCAIRVWGGVMPAMLALSLVKVTSTPPAGAGAPRNTLPPMVRPRPTSGLSSTRRRSFEATASTTTESGFESLVPSFTMSCTR